MKLELESLAIPDVKILRPLKFNDARGFFSETYNRRLFLEAGIDADFVQDNHSFSTAAGTIRGLHYQGHPFAQTKLIRVVSGRVFDVAVDIRRGSPTFGKSVAAELSANAWNQILVPIGFAHGICTLEPNTEVIYKVSSHHSAQHEYCIRWNDPDLNIAWPVQEDRITVSDKDRQAPLFRDVVHWF